MPIYLDYAASTPIDALVAEKMSQFLRGIHGNPASSHSFGQEAKAAIEQAREQVAALIQAEPNEIIWTSGATEANNLALKGAAQLYQQKGRHIITMKTEHPSVLACCQYLEKQNYQVTYLSPEKNGLLDLHKLQDAIRPDTILISIMHVNNETGIIQNIKEVANITNSHNILFHIDAAQSVGKLTINLQEVPVDLMSFSAHKVYGPKGIGALYMRRKPRIRVATQIHGGGQEGNLRSGTLATHQIVGMGTAFQVAKERLQKDFQNITELRDYFCKHLPNFTFNTDLKNSVPHILNIRFNQKAEEIISALPELAISSGSACATHGSGASYVLRAMGQDEISAAGGVRFSFGRLTTKHEIDQAIKNILSLSKI